MGVGEREGAQWNGRAEGAPFSSGATKPRATQSEAKRVALIDVSVLGSLLHAVRWGSIHARIRDKGKYSYCFRLCTALNRTRFHEPRGFVESYTIRQGLKGPLSVSLSEAGVRVRTPAPP